MFTKLQKYIIKFENTDKTVYYMEPKCVRNATEMEIVGKSDNR
jgi:hypothetical protein